MQIIQKGEEKKKFGTEEGLVKAQTKWGIANNSAKYSTLDKYMYMVVEVSITLFQ